MKLIVSFLFFSLYLSAASKVPNIFHADLKKLESEFRMASGDTLLISKKYYKSFSIANHLDKVFLENESLSSSEKVIEVGFKKSVVNKVWIRYHLNTRLDFFLNVYDSATAMGVVDRYDQNTKIQVPGVVIVRNKRVIFMRQNPDYTKDIFNLFDFIFYFPINMFSLNKENQLVYVTDYTLKSNYNEFDNRSWEETYIIPLRKYKIKSIDQFIEMTTYEFKGYCFYGKIYGYKNGIMPWLIDEGLHRN